MAKGDNEHRMLFDLRGKRRNLVKVVYGTLAVLMGLSLFLVIGGFNIAELFNDSSSTGNAAETYEDQAQRIEVKLRKDPQDTDLLASLTRAQLNAGNSYVEVQSNGARQMTPEALQQYQLASDTWSKYLESTDKVNGGVALLMAPTLLSLAEFSRTFPEILANLKAAVNAQTIVAEQRPNVNSYTTLALYTYFTGEFAAAEEAREEAKKLARSKPEREAIDKQLDETKKRAEAFEKEVERSERRSEKAAAEGGSPESLEGAGPLSEALGGQLTE